MPDLNNYWPPLLALIGAIVAWLIADSSFKTRILALEEKVSSNKISIDNHTALSQAKFEAIAVQNTASIQDRAELHRITDRLESSKASKEVVEGFKQEVTILRLEMDKRFDRLDRLMEYKLQGWTKIKLEESSPDAKS
jgi:hypothetical protein